MRALFFCCILLYDCGMKPKKSLGQHFLRSPQVVAKIIETAELSREDIVLEVGPGKGVLTKTLLERAGKVIAVEKDESLAPFLREEFKKEIKTRKLELILGDILTWRLRLQVKNYLKRGDYMKQACNLPSLGNENCDFPFTRSLDYKVVANIPYYITGEFLRIFLSGDFQPKSMTLLLQKEVAERIVAQDGKESILSISVKAYGNPTYIQTVPSHEFLPPPKVDSAILHIGGISTDFFMEMDEKAFFSLVKTGFAHKRKLLTGNLKQVAPSEKLKDAFETCEIPQMARAETLSLDEWKCVCASLGGEASK